jgi:hypothetical protein
VSASVKMNASANVRRKVFYSSASELIVLSVLILHWPLLIVYVLVCQSVHDS